MLMSPDFSAAMRCSWYDSSKAVCALSVASAGSRRAAWPLPASGRWRSRAARRWCGRCAEVDGRESQRQDLIEVVHDLPTDVAALGGGGAIGELTGDGGEVGAVGGQGLLHRGQPLGERSAGLVEEDDVPAELTAHGPDDVAGSWASKMASANSGTMSERTKKPRSPPLAPLPVSSLSALARAAKASIRPDVGDGLHVGGRGIGLGLGHVGPRARGRRVGGAGSAVGRRVLPGLLQRHLARQGPQQERDQHLRRVAWLPGTQRGAADPGETGRPRSRRTSSPPVSAATEMTRFVLPPSSAPWNSSRPRTPRKTSADCRCSSDGVLGLAARPPRRVAPAPAAIARWRDRHRRRPAPRPLRAAAPPRPRSRCSRRKPHRCRPAKRWASTDISCCQRPTLAVVSLATDSFHHSWSAATLVAGTARVEHSGLPGLAHELQRRGAAPALAR